MPTVEIDRLDPPRTALIVVDMENDFVAEGAPLDTTARDGTQACGGVAHLLLAGANIALWGRPAPKPTRVTTGPESQSPGVRPARTSRYGV